ncbi:caspase family protein [Streptomyces sp. NPDC004647]|uniref:caspase family protein n=1 Tax=Streptomyces sp. NPDC004647 TaxID=3154671 RepID=UPI0033A42059
MTSRSALLIGCSRYKDTFFAELDAPFHDLAELSTVLSSQEIGRYAVQRLYNVSATEAKVATSKLFKGVKKTDVLFIHFSCHGWLDDAYRLHLVLRDSQSQHIEATGFSVELLAELLETCASEQIILSLDCCYSGRAKRVLTHRGPKSVNLGASLEGKGSGFAILTATTEVQAAMEPSGKLRKLGAPRTSLYVTALVDGLKTGDADMNRDGIVSTSDLADYLTQRFRGHAQQPTASLFLKTPVVVALNPQYQEPDREAGEPAKRPETETICRVLRTAPLRLGLVARPGADDAGLQNLLKKMKQVGRETILGYRDMGYTERLFSGFIPVWRSHDGYLVFTNRSVHLPKGGGSLTYAELADHRIKASSKWHPGHPRQGGSYTTYHVTLTHPYRTLSLAVEREIAEPLAELLTNLAGLVTEG